MALRRAASGASQERAKRPSRHACMLLRVPPKLNPCTTGEQAKARTRWRCRPAHDAPQGAWARPKSSTAPRQRQRGLLRERGGRLARPQRQQHQRDRHRQLRDHRQPVAPRAQRALRPQPAPLLRVQRRALRAARAGTHAGPRCVPPVAESAYRAGEREIDRRSQHARQRTRAPYRRTALLRHVKPVQRIRTPRRLLVHLSHTPKS